jgi:hypothetical protein
MPLDYQSVYATVARWETRVKAFYEMQTKREAEAWESLHAWSERLEALEARVEQATKILPYWRSAAPAGESLTLATNPPADADKRVAQAVVFAADGSQIEPNPHASVYFALVNVGVVAMAKGIPPRTHVASVLWTPDELATHNLQVSLQRDLRERAVLAEIVEALHTGKAPKNWAQWEDFAAGFPAKAPLLALTDGPLELWGAKDEEGSNFRTALRTYLESLKTLESHHAIAAGFVDKPHANLVVHLLGLAMLEGNPTKDDAQAISRGDFPLQGVTDAGLFGRLLKPGQRSAVFGLASQSRKDYTGSLALHFFYLNTSPNPDRPNIPRVEIPAWVAQDAEALATLHAVLMWQSRRVPQIPYPYILHRAHEVAVVQREERDVVEGWLCRVLIASGHPFCVPSAKQQMKNLQ